jgi:succinate-acetate transporter protein
MLGTWGSFWAAYGLLNLLVAAGRLTVPAAMSPAIGFWFIALAAITWMGAAAAAADSTALLSVLGFLAAGSTLAAVGDLVGATVLTTIAGWLFIVASIAAWYTASAMLFLDAFGREVLPLGSIEPARRMWARAHRPAHAAHSTHRAA